MKTIRIIHLAGGIGGAERVLAHTVKAVTELGYKAHVDLIVGDPRKVAQLIREIAGRQLGEVKIRSFYTGYPLRAMYRIQNIILSKIHKHTSIGSGAYDLCINTKTEEALTYCEDAHNIFYAHSPFPLSRALCTLAPDSNPQSLARRAACTPAELYAKTLRERIRHGDILLVNSEFTRILVKMHTGINAQVVYPPIEAEELSKCARNKRKNIILCIARITPAKKLDLCIRVLAKLPRHDVKLVIAGYLQDTNYLLYLNKLARNLGVRDRVIFAVNLPRKLVRELYCRASVLLHPMRGEYFGMVVAEAMAAGVIPVVWSYGGPAFIAPKQFHFSSIEEAVQKIEEAFGASEQLRLRLSLLSIKRFNCSVFESNIKESIQRYV